MFPVAVSDPNDLLGDLHHFIVGAFAWEIGCESRQGEDCRQAQQTADYRLVPKIGNDHAGDTNPDEQKCIYDLTAIHVPSSVQASAAKQPRRVRRSAFFAAIFSAAP